MTTLIKVLVVDDHESMCDSLSIALEKADGSGSAAGSDGYRAAVIAAMRATDMEAVTGHITYDKYNNPIKSAVIITIEDGQAKFWGKY